MKKILILILLSLGIQSFIKAQNNVVGLHLQSFAFGEIRLSYEHAFTDKFSVLLNYGLKTKGEIPSFILETTAPTDYGLPIEAANEIGGYQFIPEFRIYFKGNDSPSGLYFSPYLRFAKYEIAYNSTINYQFTNAQYDSLPAEVITYIENNNLNQSIDVNILTDGTFSQKGLGIQLGYQWIIAERLAIDFYFLGLEVNQVDFVAEAESPDATELGIDYSQWTNEIESSINFANDIPFINADISIDVQSDKIIGTAKTLAPWYRGGIKIGFAF